MQLPCILPGLLSPQTKRLKQKSDVIAQRHAGKLQLPHALCAATREYMAWHLAKVLSSLWLCAAMAKALVFELEKPSVSSMAN